MEAIIKALKDVRDEVIPNYNNRLAQANETLLNATYTHDTGEVTLSFVDAVLLKGLLVDMKTAVYMLELHLKSSITTLETTEAMMTPATRGRPKRDGG